MASYMFARANPRRSLGDDSYAHCRRSHPNPHREEVEALPGGPAALSAKLRDLERAAGAPLLPGGPTPGRRIMAHLREPLKVSYRPAVLYGITELLSVAKRLGLAQRGGCDVRAQLWGVQVAAAPAIWAWLCAKGAIGAQGPQGS